MLRLFPTGRGGSPCLFSKFRLFASSGSNAGQLKQKALHVLERGKRRTRGITAIRVVSLWIKARELDKAKSLVSGFLKGEGIPEFAAHDLEKIIETLNEITVEKNQ
ncbi:MAG: hypothetical protein LBO79_02745 [Zoogloeaceae bacterium]|nr:hypothetical protein [Zoogloeaceae bacterium]